MAEIKANPIYDNTTMVAYYNDDNELRAYYISPVEGYKLHSKSYDTYARDESGEDTNEIILGYIPYPLYVSVPSNYDFVKNPREIYAVPIDNKM